MAGGTLADTTYSFYEVIDDYLGPWGEEGYPIQYGKRYNKAFMEDPRLLSDPNANQWIGKTGAALQVFIIDYILERYKANTLDTLKESELRQFAFDSHPYAYADSGLVNVMLTAPELLPFIASVPAHEFLPTAPDFEASIKQVAITGGIVVPQALESIINCYKLK